MKLFVGYFCIRGKIIKNIKYKNGRYYQNKSRRVKRVN